MPVTIEIIIDEELLNFIGPFSYYPDYYKKMLKSEDTLNLFLIPREKQSKAIMGITRMN